jgi:hypothetical protein
VFEKIRDLFRGPREVENIYDLIQQSEHRASGWYRIVNRSNQFIGYRWNCPGGLIRTTMPAPRGMKTDQAEIPITQRVGCTFSSDVITPTEDGIASVKARCVHCASSLSDFLKELGIKANDLPTMCLTVTALPTPVYITGTGKITVTDIESIFFAVNAVYRSQDLCAWLMSDSVYQRVRSAVDLNGRPLLNVKDDEEQLMGKPIYISPSLGVLGGSIPLNSTIVFGDLGHFHIRCSRPTVQRVLNSSIADITQGKALYVARIRMDSALLDPSGGNFPPLVAATVTA